ncbi:MAG: EAL domain-containing protein [Zoogloeaceae bacterium]|jgi:diguanylate cyclase (GGDEF)-like protein/PAS domain S-box-containing protein|nr:EAL domain-containing protein [Zoogloeaceae bacterium]
MIEWIRRSLRVRLILISVLVSGVVCALMTYNGARLVELQLQTQLQQRTQLTGTIFSGSVAIYLASRDYASLNEIVKNWASDLEGMRYIAVTDLDRRIVASSGWSQEEALLPPGQYGDVLNVENRIDLEEQPYGYMYIGLDTRFLHEARKEMVRQTVLIGMVGMLLLILLLSFPIYYLTRSLRELAHASYRAGEQSFHYVQVRGDDEIAVVVRNFNQMIDSIQRYTTFLKESEERFRAIADYTYAWENWFGPDGRLQWVNPAVTREVGYTPEECLVMQDFPLPLVHSDDQGQVRFQMKLAQEGHSGQDLEFRVISRDGRMLWMSMSWQPIHNDSGVSLGYRSSYRDISSQHRSAEELLWQAGHDHLTGLYNRRAFEQHLQSALKVMPQGTQSVVILYIDLDQFKLVNDTCGHIVGDQLLIEVTQILQACVATDEGSDSILARLGGDEFGILLPDSDEAAALHCASRIISRIRDHTFFADNHSFRLGASIGVVSARPEHRDFTDLLIAADTACYAAKEHGRNRVELYVRNDEYFRQRKEEFHSIGQVMASLEKGHFLLYYQRMDSLLPGLKTHAEILIRLRDANGQVQAPARFIEAAERYNLMPHIDRWVVENTFSQLAQWREAGIDCGIDSFAINVSGASLSDVGFPEFVQSQIDRYSINPENLCFEITESAAVGKLELALTFIERMRALGAELALDDFGSGLSSFGYLKRFKVDYLKIDGIFVKHLDQDATDRAVVATMVQLAHVYGLETIIEFVHNEAILEISRELGCAYAQGYACHVPEPLANLGKVAAT